MRIRHWIAWGLLVLVVLGVGGTAWGFSAAGYQKFVVKTGSMSPTIKPGDLVVDRPVNGDLAVGDVITFRDSQSELVTHRIAAISSEGITTKGDANETADVSRVQNADVVGVVAFVIPKGGYVVLFLSQPAGLISIGAAVVGLVLLWRLFFPAEDSTGDDDDSLAAGRHAADSAVAQAPSPRHAATLPDDGATSPERPGASDGTAALDLEPDAAGRSMMPERRPSGWDAGESSDL